MAEAMVFFLQMRILRKDIPGFQLRSDLIRPFGAALIMTAVIFSVRRFGLIPALSVAIPVYLGSIILLRALTPDEWQEYQALTAKRRAETLAHNEHARLIALSDQLEVANAQRLGYVSQLAYMRHVTLEALMMQLGLTVPVYY